MMQKALCETLEVGEDHRIELRIPPEFGNRVRLIILPDDEPGQAEEEIQAMLKSQEETGFARAVLGDPAEEVWNDL